MSSEELAQWTAAAIERAETERFDVDAGLDDARATLAEIWRRTDDDTRRKRCMRAMKAVIAAEQAMRAADEFLLAKTRAERKAAFERLRIACVLRTGPEARQRP